MHTVVASSCVTCRDLCRSRHLADTWLCIASDDAICTMLQRSTQSRRGQCAPKSSVIQFLPLFYKTSRTFWSRGHAFRVELASPRHHTVLSVSHQWGRVTQWCPSHTSEDVLH